MRSSGKIRWRFDATGRAGYGIAGMVLLVLPILAAQQAGPAGMVPELLVSALFGIGYLAVALFGGRLFPGDRSARRGDAS